MFIKSGNLVQLRNMRTGRIEESIFQGLITDNQNKAIGYITEAGPYAIELWEVYGIN